MKLVFACVAVLFLASAFAAKPRRQMSNVSSAFDGIGFTKLVNVPAPVKLFRIRYGNTKVTLGNFIPPEDTIVDLEVIDCEAQTEYVWTLMCFDPNYHGINPKKNPECVTTMLFGLLVNMRNFCDLISGDILAKLVPHATRPGTGIHNFVFIVLRQNKIINTSSNYEDDRLGFSPSAFIKEHDLCPPEYGNFFQTAYPDFEEACEEICEEQNQQQYNKYKSKRNY